MCPGRFGTMSFQMVLLPHHATQQNMLLFWNYVIPDGSTTRMYDAIKAYPFWNYVIPDGSTTI